VDDVTGEGLPSTIERWGFITLGVFTTCCYTKDFAALDLLRFPQTFTGNLSGNIVAFDLPEWFPQEHAIFRAADGTLFSKLKDLPLPRQIKPGSNKNKLLMMQLPPSVTSPAKITLTYSPWFRFAHTGSTFTINDSISDFLCRIVEYAARRSGMTCDSIIESGETRSIAARSETDSFQFMATGTDNLRSLRLEANRSQLSLNIETRTMSISPTLTPALFAAVRTMREAGSSLQNCSIVNEPSGEFTLQFGG
jgi:hypothetical protein